MRRKRRENYAHLSPVELEVVLEQTVTSAKLSATSPLAHTDDALNKDALH
jgi:hypothetical protein